MAFQKSAVAIDLGSHTIRVLEVRVSDAGVHVLRAIEVARSELVQDGGEPGDADPNPLAALAAALRQRMSAERIPVKGVGLGIGGQDVMLRYTRIPPVPAWRLKVIMDYEVGEVADKIGAPLASDFRPLQLAREADEDQTILIGLAKEAALERVLDAFEQAGVIVERAMPLPIALFACHDAFGKKADPESPDDDLVLLVDIGHENTSVALVLNDRLAFARSASLGGKSFTDSLAQTLGISPADAERVKVSKGGLDERARGVHQDTVMPLRTTAGQLLGIIQSSLRFGATQVGGNLPSLTRVILAGGGARLRGLPEFLSQGLGKPVEVFAPAGMNLAPTLPAAVAEALGKRPGDFGAAFGLGASRLREGGGGEARTTLNLLPAKYVKRRELWDRTVFLYAAGVLLGLLLVARIVHGIVENSSARKVHGDLTRQHASLSAQKKDLDQTSQAAEKRRARLNRLLQEAEQSAFQAFVLDLLSRVLRPEIQLDRIYLDRPLTEDETGFDYNLRVAGKVNNEKRQGLEWLLDLQASLKAEDRIASVDVESSRPEGAWYTFELSLRPSYIRY